MFSYKADSAQSNDASMRKVKPLFKWENPHTQSVISVYKRKLVE